MHTRKVNCLLVALFRNGTKSKRRKLESDEELEEEYKSQIPEAVNVKSLLPMKTKDGIVRRVVECNGNIKFMLTLNCLIHLRQGVVTRASEVVATFCCNWQT